jgi:NAD(P)-dependent dehydrogenase (short-subunit alcohol dehydrogenase family)
MNPFPPQVAFITGAGSGIGRELALQFAQLGSAIAAVDIVPDGLISLEADFKKRNQRSAWSVADVTDATGLRDKTAELEKQLGSVDLLIANAGIGIETSALDFNVENMNAVIKINLIGVSNSIGAVLPGMLERRRGHIAAMSSVASFRGLPRLLAYCAAKSGVNALLDGLRVEVNSYGIDVTTICPGWIKTPMTDRIKGRMEGLMELDYAARQIIDALRRRRAFFAFPGSLVRRLRFLSWLPLSWSDWMIQRMIPKSKDKR